MPVTDSIGDMLTRIRNAGTANHKKVEIPRSNMKWEIAKILHDQGYIEKCEDKKDNIQGTIIVTLKYFKRKPVIKNIERISKPGRRVYVDSNNLTRVKNGLGIAIVSTSKGVMTVKQAKQDNVGGEVLCSIW